MIEAQQRKTKTVEYLSNVYTHLLPAHWHPAAFQGTDTIFQRTDCSVGGDFIPLDLLSTVLPAPE